MRFFNPPIENIQLQVTFQRIGNGIFIYDLIPEYFKPLPMKKTFLIISISAALLGLSIASCNDSSDSTGNGAHMPATNNDPGNTTSDNSSKNNVNSPFDRDSKAGEKGSTGGRNVDLIPDSLKSASPHHPH